MPNVNAPSKSSPVISPANSTPHTSSLDHNLPVDQSPSKKAVLVENTPDSTGCESGVDQSLTPLLLEDVFTMRWRVVGRRVDVQNERQYYSEQRKLAMQAQQVVTDLCNSFLSSCDTNHPQPHVKSLLDGLDNVRESYSLLENIDHNLQQEESKLNGLEDALRKKEVNLYERLTKDHDVAVGSYTLAGNAPSFKDTLNFSSRDSSTTNSASLEPLIVQEYYDKIGDVGILKERLFNFEAEHQRQMKVRENRRDASRKGMSSDSKFFENYFEKRRDLVQEYVTGVEAVRNLKAKCHDQGHDVEEPNIPPLEGRDALDRIARTDSHTHINLLVKTNGIPTSNMTQPIQLYHADSMLRVIQWLEDVSKHQPLSIDEASSLAPSVNHNSQATPDLPPQHHVDRDTDLDQVRHITFTSRNDTHIRSRSNSMASLDPFSGDIPPRRHSDAFIQVRKEVLRETVRKEVMRETANSGLHSAMSTK